MTKSKSKGLFIGTLLTLIAFVAIACVDTEELRAELRQDVKQSVTEALVEARASSPPVPTTEEIRGLVEQAIQSAVPEGTSPEEIRALVEQAIAGVAQTTPTTEEIRALVEQAIQSAVPEGTSPEEIRALVQQAVAASAATLPSPEEISALVEQAVAEAGPSAEDISAMVQAALAAAATAGAIDTVNVLGVWGGDELESFRAVVKPWEEATGGKMNFEGTRDLTAVVTTRVAAGNPPDIAILPNPGFMAQLAGDGALQRLDAFMNMDRINNEYSKAWIDLGSVDEAFYSIFFKASPKGTVWYNPKQFEARGWSVPSTWDEMIALSDQMVAAGMAPWSVAVESGAASGWPSSDWLQQLILSDAGPDVYDGLLDGTVSWTDPAVKAAFEKFGQIVHTDGYVPGGSTAILSTGFIEGSYLPYNDPPQAQMYFLGSFTQGFIAEQFPDLVAGEDYSFFDFPTVTPDFAGAITGGADVVVAFNDDPGTVSLMRYLSSAGAQQIWVSRGGFTAVNNQVSLSAYPDELARLAAQQLTGAQIFRFDLDDLLGGETQSAIWQALLDYIQNPSDLDDILADLDAVASGG